MTLEFQEDLIKYFAQSRDARKYIEWVEPDIFDLDTHFTVFGLLKSFVAKYSTQPNLGSMLEFFKKEIKSKKESISPEVVVVLEDSIREVYERFTGNAEFIRDVIIEEYQIKKMKALFIEKAKDLKDGNSDVVHEVFKEVTSIRQLSDRDAEEHENNRGDFLLADHVEGRYSVIEGEQTYLKALNRMTSTKGFYSPQLVVFMGAPKSFKTGTLLNIAVNYVRDGYKVYYVDCENGQDRIRDRARQCMLEATFDELVSGEFNSTLSEMVERYKVMGGDFKADFYPAHTKSMTDVEAELEYLRDEFGWVPDIICYDYLDLMKPVDYTIKEKRLKIQAVYFDAIRLQKKWGLIGLTLSQVSKEAVNKEIIDMTNFAEDFGKAANCHAAFALCRTQTEQEAGVMRIIPVVQRDGVAQHSHAACFVKIDESRMSIQEIKKDVWKKMRDDAQATMGLDEKQKDKKRVIKRTARGKKQLTDD